MMRPRPNHGRCMLLALCAVLQINLPPWTVVAEQTEAIPASDAKILATVNEAPITAAELEFALFLRRLNERADAATRRQVLDQLIDRHLMRSWLAERKAKPDDREIEEQVQKVRSLIQRNGGDPEEILKKLQLSKQRLNDEVALPLAWSVHSRKIITDSQLRDFWMKHRQEFDGTQLRASHILIKASKGDGAAMQTAREKLSKLKTEIEAGRLTFAEAAQQSDAPSKSEGGDVGFFPFRGKMPASFSEAAFQLKDGAVSDPVNSPFGVHLIRVTERRPGDLSLEDVRNEVFQRLQQQLWNEILKDLRTKANIQYMKVD